MLLKPAWVLTIFGLAMGWNRPLISCGIQVPDPQGARQDAGVAGGQIIERIEEVIRSRKFDQAERLVDDYLKSSTVKAVAYYEMGKLYFENQQWARAASLLQESIRLQNQNDLAHLLLGLTWRELKKPDHAERELIEATKQNPGSDVSAYLAGHQLLLMGKFEAALPHLYRAIALNPRRPEVFRALGVAQARSGNYGLAESYLRKAIEIADDLGSPDAAAYKDLAYLLLLGHDEAKTREGLWHAQRALHLQPTSADAHYLVGKALFKLGRLPEAIVALRGAAKLNPDDSKPHFLLARAFDRLGKQQEARIEREALGRTKRRLADEGIATGGSVALSPQ